MTAEELKTRSKRFALRTMELVDLLPQAQAGRVFGGHISRAEMSANKHRAADNKFATFQAVENSQFAL